MERTSYLRPDYAPVASWDGIQESTSPYDLQTLDYQWYPLISGLLPDQEQRRRTDFTDGTGGRLNAYSLDEIDARGAFSAREFEAELRSYHPLELENRFGITYKKLKEILKRADPDRDGLINYGDWIQTVRDYRLSTEGESKLRSLGRAFAYAEEFSCTPPPYFMIVITFIEALFFVYHSVHLSAVHGLAITMDGPVPYCSVLIYNPQRRWEIWRYFTYMFVHIGIAHFVFNMISQIVVGVFLEMEQEGYLGSLRVLSVYLSGVLAGSLGTSISDPDTYIAGASGGVYALIAAHLATLVLNWREDSAVKIPKIIHKSFVRIFRVLFLAFFSVVDVSYAIYVRCFTKDINRTGFMGHFCGALAGLLVGIFILQNRRVKSWEPFVQWASFSIFTLMIGFTIAWNILGNQWVPRFYMKPDYRLYDDKSGNCRHYNYI